MAWAFELAGPAGETRLRPSAVEGWAGGETGKMAGLAGADRRVGRPDVGPGPAAENRDGRAPGDDVGPRIGAAVVAGAYLDRLGAGSDRPEELAGRPIDGTADYVVGGRPGAVGSAPNGRSGHQPDDGTHVPGGTKTQH
jgi:hypothetical protein